MKRNVFLFQIVFMVIILFLSGCMGMSSSDTIQTYQRPASIPPGYWQYNNSDLHFSVYLPEDWESYNSHLNKPEDPVYLYNKNIGIEKNGITILLRDISTSPFADNSIQHLNDRFIEEYKFGIDPAVNVIVKNKGERYLINGHESIGNVITAEGKGSSSISKSYIIKNESKVYVIYYVAADDVYNAQINTVESIVGSFVPTQ
jgi:hypothetical protein